jgi:hypothetical protein
VADLGALPQQQTTVRRGWSPVEPGYFYGSKGHCKVLDLDLDCGKLRLYAEFDCWSYRRLDARFSAAASPPCRPPPAVPAAPGVTVQFVVGRAQAAGRTLDTAVLVSDGSGVASGAGPGGSYKCAAPLPLPAVVTPQQGAAFNFLHGEMVAFAAV